MTLDQWLAWQERLHPVRIEMGLERVARVLGGMTLGPPPCKVITVAGTNGKGSSVAMLESILLAAGYRVGAYYSPHLLRYNERIRVDGREVSDATLCRAFAAVEQARGEMPLTYFEFGTLAALEIFFTAGLDAVVLEVGLGGRLDAVNAVDCDVALITGIGLDHCQWLGNDRETVAYEKAGIMRRGRPAVCSDPAPPRSLLNHADGLDVPLTCIGRDFGYTAHGNAWSWWGGGRRRTALPWPALRGEIQLQNAAGALMVLEALAAALPVPQAAVRAGLLSLNLAGRFQVLPGMPMRILDVAHNPHAAAVLAAALRRQPCRGVTHGVFGMLEDKDIAGVVRAMENVVNVWHTATLAVERGAIARHLAECVTAVAAGSAVYEHTDPQAAYAAAGRAVGEEDRIIVFGSFYTVAAVLALENQPAATNTSAVQV
jgi:dihydrofolate synthase/folylpolyglutamate synthase